jgi:hypothetical protein
MWPKFQTALGSRTFPWSSRIPNSIHANDLIYKEKKKKQDHTVDFYGQ